MFGDIESVQVDMKNWLSLPKPEGVLDFDEELASTSCISLLIDEDLAAALRNGGSLRE
jgi:hypothetical protein